MMERKTNGRKSTQTNLENASRRSWLWLNRQGYRSI
nr:MAG TPA: hypothetical protein [Caudoviricetes sp.]